MDELILKYSEVFSVGLEEAREKITKLRDTMVSAFRAIKDIFVKLLGDIKQFFNRNPEIIRHILKKNKHEKRVFNRNALYEKRKKLGRKL
ncbi:MAG TPA: hypothetical protein VIK26_01480 [Clostridium sp.]